jgi:hypothetical protein
MVLRHSVDFILHRNFRLFIVIIIALCLGSASVIGAQDAPSLLDVGVCATTIEQLHGQGRFEMGGLSRFSYSGLEGSSNNLTRR